MFIAGVTDRTVPNDKGARVAPRPMEVCDANSLGSDEHLLLM